MHDAHQTVTTESPYGDTGREWLRRWDAGEPVHTIEMGGLGPSYEQCIQITAAEVLRHMLKQEYRCGKWDDKSCWQADLKQIEAFAFEDPTIGKLGLSGAQWAAAVNLAAQFYQNGPAAVMADERVKDRHIMARRSFPSG